jgi:two-component system cell cycle sensor histidine kinase PleC
LIKNTEDYTSVIEGRSLVLGPYSIQVNNKTSKKEYVLTALLPIFDSSNENINYVIAITYEVTKAYWFINVVCIALTLCCLVVAILVYILMLYRSIQHSKLLSKQYEINSILEDAKQKAEEDSIRKSNFFANLSHELRTPLNAIIGFSKIIHEESMGSLGNSQYKEYAKDINISGEHLLSLINDILDFAKADSGKLEVSLSPLDVTKLAKSSLRMMMPRAEEVNVKLVEKIAQKNMLIQANSKRLKQVMLNLLSNAVKFAPAGEKVVLHLYYEKDNIIIQVQDTGIGIDQKDIASVMSAYGQVDNKSFREHEGTGLGLPLTKKLVELMKGKFNIKSEPGLGTTITLTFKAEHIDFNELTENQEHEKSDF